MIGYINQANVIGHFFVTKRPGVLTLIPKKKDQTFLSNKGAICLLDITYKIVTRVLTNKLMEVIHKEVSTDQTGSINPRPLGGGAILPPPA